MRAQAMQVTARLCDPLDVTPCSCPPHTQEGLQLRRLRTPGPIGSPVLETPPSARHTENSEEGRGASCAFIALMTAQAAAGAQEKTLRARSPTRRHAPGHGHATHDRGDTKHRNFLSLVASLLPIFYP